MKTVKIPGNRVLPGDFVLNLTTSGGNTYNMFYLIIVVEQCLHVDDNRRFFILDRNGILRDDAFSRKEFVEVIRS